MINAEDDIIVNLRTSCTKDEAVAMLLGWLRGPIKPRNIQISEDGLSLDQLPFLQSLEGSLQDQLQELVDAASQAFRLAAESGADLNAMKKKEMAVEERRTLVERAAKFARDIDDEINSHTNHRLIVDEFETNRTGEQHISISSLDRWARDEHQIPIVENEYDEPNVISGTSKGRATSESEELSPTKTRSSHITTALLIKALANSSGKKYVHGDSPNIKEIATRLSEMFTEEVKDCALGQSFESIRKRLKKSMDIYKEEVPSNGSR
jgi:hypothetical protein